MDLINACFADCNKKYILDHVVGLEKCRLLELGFIRGSNFEILKKSSNKGPIYVKINDCKIALKYETASGIYLTEDL